MTFDISRDHRMDMHMNNGMFNGKQIYIHYTSHVGHGAIMNQRCIASAPDMNRRGRGAQAGVYLAQAKDAMSNQLAHSMLFLGEDRYRHSATHCIVFTFQAEPYLQRQAVSQGSQVHEVIYPGNIPFHRIDVIYEGLNPFL